MIERFKFIAILLFIVCLTQVAADIYSPSLPALSTYFGVPVDQVQFSMALYMLGVALSQVVYGPLSEAYGRKKPILLGLCLMLIGCSFCLFATNIHMLLGGRFIQGIGAGSCASLWRSIFRDVFKGEDLAKYASYLSIAIMFVLPCTPLLGGYLQALFGWHGSFWFMIIFTIVGLIGTIFYLHETYKDHHPSKFRFSIIIKNYKTLLTSPIFIGSSLSTAFGYGSVFCWVTVGPVLLIEHLGLAPDEFGQVSFYVSMLTFPLGALVNGRAVARFGVITMLRLGWICMVAGGVTMLITYLALGTSLNAILFSVVLYFFGTMFIMPNVFAMAFTPFGHIAGYAGALYGGIQIAGASLLSALIAYLPDETPLPFSLIVIASGVASWGACEIGRHYSREK